MKARQGRDTIWHGDDSLSIIWIFRSLPETAYAPKGGVLLFTLCEPCVGPVQTELDPVVDGTVRQTKDGLLVLEYETLGSITTPPELIANALLEVKLTAHEEFRRGR